MSELRISINCIPATPSTMKSLEDSVVRAVEEFPRLAADLSRMLQHINQLSSDPESQRLPEKVTGMLSNAGRTLALLQSKFNDVDVKELSKASLMAFEHLNQATSQMRDILSASTATAGC